MGEGGYMEVSAAQAFRELAALRKKSKAKHISYKDYIAKGNRINPALLASNIAKPKVENLY